MKSYLLVENLTWVHFGFRVPSRRRREKTETWAHQLTPQSRFTLRAMGSQQTKYKETPLSFSTLRAVGCDRKGKKGSKLPQKLFFIRKPFHIYSFLKTAPKIIYCTKTCFPGCGNQTFGEVILSLVCCLKKVNIFLHVFRYAVFLKQENQPKGDGRPLIFI